MHLAFLTHFGSSCRWNSWSFGEVRGFGNRRIEGGVFD